MLSLFFLISNNFIERRRENSQNTEGKKSTSNKGSIVCSPIQSRGLGTINMRCFNEALLGKWLWRFGTKRCFLEKGNRG